MVECGSFPVDPLVQLFASAQPWLPFLFIVYCIYYTFVYVLMHVKITVPEVLETPQFRDSMTSHYVTMSKICIIYAKWLVWHAFGKCALSLLAVATGFVYTC